MNGERTAIVTGGSRGIGRAVVHRLREQGMRVASLDVSDPDPGEALDVADLDLRCDVTDEQAVADAVARVTAELGAATVLVNNAGINAYFDAVEMTPADWDRFMALDLKASWICARAVLPTMRAARWGSIVNVASIHARLTSAGRFPYAAAKAGLIGLTRSLALDEARRGVRVNAVSPGLILTRLAREGIEKDAGGLTVEQVEADLPMGRAGDPLDVADVVAFLCGDRAAYVTGAELAVDGGVGALLPTI